ncbi:MAG TPA: phosphatase PAP2 family protein [Myxococcota bacterium]|nr:phosphatase PAP2 family protein [Myxococcota bacterium]
MTTAATGEATSLGATDRIALAYAIVLAALAAICRVRPPALLLAISLFVAGVVAVARLASVSRAGRVVHDFAPIAFVIALFGFSAPVVAAVNPTRWDARLAALDRAWFGALPALWVGLWGRPEWLTEVASILYASYYAIPIAIAVALYRRGRRADFEFFVFAAVATFLASYIGYLLTPALGPRAPAAREAPFDGYAVSAWLQAFLRSAEWNQLDAFPSGHVALSLVYFALGSRLLPRWRLPLAGLTAGIVFSTVYLSLHYVVDLLAGGIVAAVMLPVSSALYRVLDQRPSS